MMKRSFLGNRAIQLGATSLAFISMLSVLAWVIKTDQNAVAAQVINVSFIPFFTDDHAMIQIMHTFLRNFVKYIVGTKTYFKSPIVPSVTGYNFVSSYLC